MTRDKTCRRASGHHHRSALLLLTSLLLASACADEPDDTGGAASEAASGTSAGGNDTTPASTSATGGAGGQGTGGQGVGGQGAGEPDGSWAHPYLITELPFIDQGSTVNAISSQEDSYFPCGPMTNEGGPEVVYRVSVPAAGWLSAQVDDVPGDQVDVDLQLLAANSPDSCITRNDSWLGAPVTPGEYWLVVDTWVNGANTALPGDYILEVSLTEEGNQSCLQSPIACDGMLPPFVNMDFTEAPGDAGCLPGMARVEDFCVDRYEAMLVSLDSNNNWLPVSPFEHPSDNAIVMALSIEGSYPQGHISQIQAEDACLTAGKRLCTNNEWLRACQGSASTTYPYGNALEPGRCNDDRECHPVPQYFESAENWIWSELAHPCISQLPDGLAVTGSYSSCVTSESVFDMMGNMHEWTADPAGTFRGGFYVDTVVNGPGCLYATTAHDVSHHDYSTGFRCCDEAMP